MSLLSASIEAFDAQKYNKKVAMLESTRKQTFSGDRNCFKGACAFLSLGPRESGHEEGPSASRNSDINFGSHGLSNADVSSRLHGTPKK